MDQNEKGIIENLFGRLQQAESQSGPRDAAAEAHIREAVERQPAAPYYMAQAIVVQEQALKNLNERVEQLQRELAERPAGGGFLGGLFGADQPGGAGANRPAGSGLPSGPPQAGLRQQGAGGFLGGALQTAAAVAGGVLLGNAIAGLFSQDAQAAEAPEEPTATELPPVEEEPEDPWSGGGDEDWF